MRFTTSYLQNRTTRLAIFFATALLFSLSACYYDKADVVYPPPANCDSLAATYSQKVLPILSAQCYSCHSGTAIAGAGIKLDSYNNVKLQVNNGRLLGAVAQNPGFSPMPKGGKLTACQIGQIRNWINAGAPNN
jgi:mono/diheme cytochrome c family protein